MDGNLTKLNTFKIGGTCRSLAFPKSLEELILLLKEKEDYVLLGNGSNVLIYDGYIDKDFIVTTKLDKINEEFWAECGLDFSCFCEKAYEKGLSGLEFMYKIPGTVGGCLYMNAGAFGHTISEVVKKIKVYDKKNDKIIYLTADECDYSYKKSVFMERDYIILEACFNLTKADKSKIKSEMEEIRNKRIESQPKEPSAGSFFKRPNGNMFASKMIDECNLKGYRVGDAIVSPKHAGFICNIGNATFNDVIKVSEHVKMEVYKQTGICLVEEVKIIR